jgi:hypothetical protein
LLAACAIVLLPFGADAQRMPHWTVDARPAFDVGAGPGILNELSRVTGAARLSDGRIVAVNAATELRYYAPDGTYLFTRGRSGNGPGEYGGIFRLLRGSGDSLVVVDGELGRVTVLSPNGEVGRIISNAGRWAESIVSHRADGGFIAGPVFLRSEMASPTVRRSSFAVQRVSPDGALVSTLVDGMTEDSYRIVKGPERYVGPLPFGMQIQVAAWAQRVYVASAPAYLVTVIDASGAQRRPIQKAGKPERVNSTHVREFIEDQLTGVRSASARSSRRTVLEELPTAEELPTIAELVSDSHGNLWVRDYAILAESRSSWSVFDSTGEQVATASLPPAFAVQQIGSDWVLGVQRDQDRVEHVVLYALRK